MPIESLQLPEGHKFACVMAEVLPMTPDVLPRMDFGNLVFTQGPPFVLDASWKTSLGALTFAALEEVNLAFTLYEQSLAPAILDDENRRLESRVQLAFHGLLLSGLPHTNTWTVLTGACVDGGIQIRQHSTGDRYFGAPGSEPKPVTRSSVEMAAVAFHVSDAIYQVQPKYWRFRRGFNALVEAARSYEADFKFHQYVRATEALLKPCKMTSRRFAEYASRLVGLLGRAESPENLKLIYDIRCSAEHMNEMTAPLRRLEYNVRIEKVHECIRMMEEIALASYRSILGTPGLVANFEDERTLKAFWAKPNDEIAASWSRR